MAAVVKSSTSTGSTRKAFENAYSKLMNAVETSPSPSPESPHKVKTYKDSKSSKTKDSKDSEEPEDSTSHQLAAASSSSSSKEDESLVGWSVLSIGWNWDEILE